MTDHELASGSNFTFETAHRHLEAYSRALESGGFLLEAIREPRTTPDVEREEGALRWRRLPCFLYARARKVIGRSQRHP